MKTKNIVKLVASVFICQMAGLAGAMFTTSSIDSWYSGLQKPLFTPPNWAFFPVWTVLYALMGVALFLVWKQDNRERKVKAALAVFGVQLALNVLWSLIFFGMKLPGYAFVEIIFLWVTILLTIAAFYRVSRTAAQLLIPYIIWVSLAAALNYCIFSLNSA